MKLFSKTLARILGNPNETELIVFNQGDKYEFGECGNCGREIEAVPAHSGRYSSYCPECMKHFKRQVKAEEVK